MADAKPRIAVFAGATATILNSGPLVTSNLARRRHGLPLRTDPWGQPLPWDVLRPQRLARPVTVYVEQFSAHPLERDSAHLYADPDGYVNAAGEFHPDRSSPDDVPVYEVELRPEDGLIPLPYVARQQDGSPWDGDCATPGGSPAQCRQPFYPDASRVFEEIDRLGVDEEGVGNLLASMASYDFIRVLPPGGYTTGRSEEERTDLGSGAIRPEALGDDYFPYRPPHLRREPPRRLLAQLTNRVHDALAGTSYAGAVWLEGSPFIEETIYWLNLLIDTRQPIVACSSPDFPHGTLGAGGDRHIVDAVRYIRSGISMDEDGRDRVGAVLLSSEQVFAAREVQKSDARPGGYIATGGHGGIVATTGEPGPPVLTYLPVWQHTYRSDVRLSVLPDEVQGVTRSPDGLVQVPVRVKDAAGGLEPDAIPFVSFHKHARFLTEDGTATADHEVELLARIERNLERHPLAGFVLEGGAPYGHGSPSSDAAMRLATFSGMPVVRTSRGNAEGFVTRERVKLGIAGSNLTATKARILLMACLLKFGSLPPAKDPANPTPAEVEATETALARFQEIFETH
jgi:L-asparaginase